MSPPEHAGRATAGREIDPFAPESAAEREWLGRVPYRERRGVEEPLPRALVDLLVGRALREDLGAEGADGGDRTSAVAVPARAHARARLVAKSAGRLAGLDVFARTFELCDRDCRVHLAARDGDDAERGRELALVEGNARALLAAERTALNLVQRMCGIATHTARFVAAAGGAARILDTRKTNPGLRAFDKYAVRCGGGESHRFGLFDEAMVKENHVALAGRPLEQVVRDLRERCGDGFRITAEARDEAEAVAGVRGGADIVLLDNMDAEALAAVVPRLRELARERRRPLELEASGGIDLTNVGRVARSGVDRISIGALTHSAPALDLSLYLEPAG